MKELPKEELAVKEEWEFYIKYRVKIYCRIFSTQERAEAAFERVVEGVRVARLTDETRVDIFHDAGVACWILTLIGESYILPEETIHVIMEGIKSDKELTADEAEELREALEAQLQKLEDQFTRNRTGAVQRTRGEWVKTNSR